MITTIGELKKRISGAVGLVITKAESSDCWVIVSQPSGQVFAMSLLRFNFELVPMAEDEVVSVRDRIWWKEKHPGRWRDIADRYPKINW